MLFDSQKIQEIIRDIKSRPGIVDILIETNSGHLAVGDEIVAIMVAGDIRENVFPALIDAPGVPITLSTVIAVRECEKLFDRPNMICCPGSHSRSSFNQMCSII